MSRIKTSVKSIGEAISVCLNNHLTFAAYRLPNQTEQVLMVQKSPETEEVNDLSNITQLKGFLVAPFLRSERNKMFIIKPDFYFNGEVPGEDFDELTDMQHSGEEVSNPLPHEVSKEEYLQQINTITDSIKKNHVQKVVLSRVKVVSHESCCEMHEIFLKLCNTFPNAFVYIFKAKGHFWVGATPEPFAFLKDNVFRTSSVAGTKENKEEYQLFKNWGSKEKQEQQYVSDYIDNMLHNNHWENIEHHGPYVKKAGNVLHLRTDFTSNASTMNGDVGNLLQNLHPTPAVCGFPKSKALKIIQSVEKHDREYYSGFLGPVGMQNPITLFVNLRCMQIVNSSMILYAGGGLTIDSHPEDEWYETEIKTGTLLSVIHNNH